MSEIVEPPRSRLTRAWRSVPESWRLPLVFIVPALLVIALMPLLFMDGGGALGIMRRELGGMLGDGSKSAGVFENKADKPLPAVAMPAAPAVAAAPPMSSLTRPTDGSFAFGGGPAASAAPGEGEGKEGALAKEEADLDGMSGNGSSGVGAAGGSADAGKSGKLNTPKLAARQSQFSYQGGVGSGGMKGAPAFRGFDFGKAKAGAKGAAVGAGPGSSAETPAGMAMGALDTQNTNKITQKANASGGASMASGGADAHLDALTGSWQPGADSGGAGGAVPGLPDYQKCEEARTKYSATIQSKSTAYNQVIKQRYEVMDCRKQGCAYAGYDCERWARSHARMWYSYLKRLCTCGQLACRSISLCRELNDLNCKVATACGGSCSSADCR